MWITVLRYYKQRHAQSGCMWISKRKNVDKEVVYPPRSVRHIFIHSIRRPVHEYSTVGTVDIHGLFAEFTPICA